MMFCALIVISQMVRLSEVILAFGITLENLILPFLYIVAPFLTIVIPMAYLFSVMMSFSRMSMDGELTAMFAAGYSLKKMLLPVFVVGFILFLCGSACAIYLESWGRREFVDFTFKKTQTELDSIIRTRIQPGVFVSDFLGYTLFAEEVNSTKTEYKNIMLMPEQSKTGGYIIMAPDGQMEGTVEGGDLQLSLRNGKTYAFGREDNSITTVDFQRTDIDILRVFYSQIFGSNSVARDYRSFGPVELSNWLDQQVSLGQNQTKQYYKAHYMFHSRFANPFGIFVFGFFGLLLGLQDQRRGKNWGYIGAVATVIACYVFIMAFRTIAEDGKLNAIAASWIPQFILVLICSFMLYQKNRLPLSENIFSLANLNLFKGKVSSQTD